MKKFSRMAGVTLLEVMLVLAVAAMIIVMSIRYYQSATTSQQVTGALNLLQGIQAAADGLAQGEGSYSNVTSAQIIALMPNQTLNTPWGTPAVFGGQSVTGFTVTFNSINEAICLQVRARMQSNNKWTVPDCSATTNQVFAYDASA